ncbi:LOW QUALITY PROTEIN: hypothetical protein HID58_035196 [Brassica napus]|uniref:Uncharacterized protein n=1 Tax=Brassica napus TaxID=3708 RepID=A0ABQ8C612_BRANA|nr:LOW QUALITY PROTEIN: hypothetical protein HID58_035196 [Brassica napus]
MYYFNLRYDVKIVEFKNGVVAVTFDIHFTTSGQSRRDGLGVHFNQLNYASAPYLRCQTVKEIFCEGSSLLRASSYGLAIVLLIQSSFYPLPSTNGFSVLLIQSSLPSLHPTNEVTEKFVERYSNIKFLQGYGLTETAAIVASMFTKEETERYGSSGLLAPNVDDCGSGYGSGLGGALNRGALPPESYRDERLKELIKCNRYQVAPAELEALLLAHPEIADAAKSLSKLNIDFAQPKQQVYSKSLRPSFVTVRAMSESQTALKNQPQNASTLENAGVSVTSKVETLTHFPEMASFILYLVQLDGRVKSLHPNIHGGILAGRDVDHHMEALNEHGIDMKKCPFLHCLHFSIILVSLRLLQDPFFICFDSDVSAL